MGLNRYTMVKIAQLPKGGLVRGHDKPIHGSCAIYFPGNIFGTDSRSPLTIFAKKKRSGSALEYGIGHEQQDLIRRRGFAVGGRHLAGL